MNTKFLQTLATALLTCGALAFMGCDSTTGVEGDVRFQGTVTDDAGYGKTQAEIEGAVVTASNVSAEGELSSLSGSATTDAEGEYALDVDSPANEVVLQAEGDNSFASSAMVYTGGQGVVTAMPMTVESDAEADVFVEARAEDEEDDVTMSTVAAYVTQEVAADIEAGAESAADVAVSIVAEAETRTRYVEEEAGEEEAEDARDNENAIFFQFQADLATSASAEEQAQAREEFEEALIDAYTVAGVTLETQAKARAAAREALVRFGDSTFEMEKQAEIFASMATALAVEASFEDAGASGDRIDVLADARADLIADLRASASEDDIEEAKEAYEAVVDAELAAEAEVEASLLAAARDALAAAQTALDVALTAATSASAVAEAHVTFYASAETAAEGVLADNAADAAFAATVIALLSVS